MQWHDSGGFLTTLAVDCHSSILKDKTTALSNFSKRILTFFRAFSFLVSLSKHGEDSRAHSTLRSNSDATAAIT
jgi:hypothetical protein